MKIRYDKEIDALYIELRNVRVHKTLKQSDSFLVDVDKKGGVIGIEILHFSKSAPKKERFQISTGQERILLPA